MAVTDYAIAAAVKARREAAYCERRSSLFCHCAVWVPVDMTGVPYYEHPYVDDAIAGCGQVVCAHGAKCGGLLSLHVVPQ